MDDRQALFDMCTARCAEEDQKQYFVSMYRYFLTRGELQCLQRRRWINDRFMTMVARTFVGDQKDKEGRVNRHIFSADFMQKMVANPLRWKWEDHEREILPKYIGYNIGDCDFLFGPTLFENHWFCYVLETKTMTFYALDSLVDSITFLRLQVEEEAAKKKGMDALLVVSGCCFLLLDALSLVTGCCMNYFHTMLRAVKPELFANEDNIGNEVTWAKVYVQNETDSCGVHVLSWLQEWDGTARDAAGYTMPRYSNDELQELKVGCLWWLVTHPHNEHRDEVMSLLSDYNKSKRRR
ncbi:uncharacterized protein LOC114721456 [Neltuma alba]|uniref:uncharacterized protein LOC114721456 n=1 Tax=Neltuma alba TaxID=207710 RepID=UPI0010A3CEF8|nr:uncharacterized protein LOC114721456 [Prosopis alba]